MFEGTLVESRGMVASGTERWSALGSVAVQCFAAASLVVVPLMHPGILPLLVDAPKVFLPVPPRPPVPTVRVQEATSTSTAMSVPAASAAPMSGPRIQTMSSLADIGEPRPEVGTGPNLAGSGLPSALIGTGTAPIVTTAAAKPKEPTRVSGGVLAGMLLAPIQPTYPPIAKAAGVQGTVVMESMISQSGRIESLHVVSGPPMLQRAALEAVQVARYQPYKLNGEATEVQTTIIVNFKLGS